jgi:hypothetical protein
MSYQSTFDVDVWLYGTAGFKSLLGEQIFGLSFFLVSVLATVASFQIVRATK